MAGEGHDGEHEHARGRHLHVLVPPVLAVEILSPSSRRTDLVAKPDVLARFGCRHYWVVDPQTPGIRVYRLVGDADESGEVVMGEATFEVREPFEVSFRLSDLTR
nr:Uma2 family endonuclease [Serinicoccus kebangsaanensis]